jgi:hypothetical protein
MPKIEKTPVYQNDATATRKIEATIEGVPVPKNDQ